MTTRMPRARRIRLLALIAALAAAPLALAACTAPAPASTPSVAPAGLAVAIQQGRLDVVGHRLVVRFENTGDDPLTIVGFVVETPSLEPGLERTKPFELTPGDAIAIRLDLPASRCDAEPGPVVVRFDARTASGSDQTDELVADDPFDTIARVNAADCLAESVADVAAIVMPEHLRSTGAGADRRAFIDVAIEPVASGDASMHIARVYGTTLLNAEDGIDWTLGLDVAAGEARSVISLPVRPARCDAHAIADDKRGTILPFEIETADGRAGRLDVPASDGLKAELYAYYGERCGLQ
jgi:hypothetical protein